MPMTNHPERCRSLWSRMMRDVLVESRAVNGRSRRLPHSNRKRLAYRLMYRALRFGDLSVGAPAEAHFRRLAVLDAEADRRRA